MRLFLAVGILVVGLALFLAPKPGFAFTSPHGSYTMTTDKCAACHSTHTALSADLLSASTTRALCDSCHTGYQGSDYDAEAGTIKNGGANTPSLAGGLTITGTVTSAHMIDVSRNPLVVPGGANATNTALVCTSCHDPHGSSNYRNFQEIVTWNGLNYTVSNFTATLSSPLGAEAVTYLTGSVGACTSCHQDYATRVGGSYSSGFRHKMNVMVNAPTYTAASLPLEQQSPANRLVCLTCHKAHGTTVAANSAESGREGYSTALKRMADYGLCSKCHFNKP